MHDHVVMDRTAMHGVVCVASREPLDGRRTNGGVGRTDQKREFTNAACVSMAVSSSHNEGQPSFRVASYVNRLASASCETTDGQIHAVSDSTGRL